MNEETTTSTSVRQSVLERIETENVCPRGRFLFWCKDSVVWVLWAGSVLIGAVAVAVMLFAVNQTRFMLYEVTHDSFFGLLVASVPYLWLVVFGAMTALAVTNLRHTKRGYRYSVVQIMGSSVVLSLAGGALLQLGGLGAVIDSKLGHGMPMYPSQEKFETSLWQVPQEGRLIGRQVAPLMAPTSTILFEDATGVRWTIMVDELSAYDIALLATLEPVRMVGTTSSFANKQFHACATFPWQLKPMANDEVRSLRQAFLQRMHAHTEHPEAQVSEVERAVYAPGAFDPVGMAVCANVAMMYRVEKYLKE